MGPDNPEPISDADPAPTDVPVNDTDPAPEPTPEPTPETAPSNGDKPQTAFDADPGDQDPADTPTNWPDDWREKYAGDDEKKLAKLKRYSDPKAALDALFAAQQKLSTEGAPEEFPADGTDEEKAAWRKEAGLPETHDQYDTDLGEGWAWGEADQPYIDSYLKKMHDKNANPELVKAGLESYKEMVEEQSVARYEQDIRDKQSLEDELRADLGNQYRASINMVKNHLSSMPEYVAELIANGRDGQGRALMNSPEFVRWFLNDHINVVNPMTSVLNATGKDSMQSIDDELSEIAQKRKEDSKAYFKNEKLLKRERDLIEAKQKLESKS